MGGLEIAALLAMIGGTAMQYKATSDAAKRAKQESLQALQRQEEFSRQAEKKALDQAKQYQTGTRQEEQEEIAEQMTQEMLAPVESATEINTAATTTQGDVSEDYANAKTQSQLNLKKNAEQFARLMGKASSASRLRGNESVRMADMASDIERIAGAARRTGDIDQYAVRLAAMPDAGLAMAGSVISGLGSMGLSAGLGAKETGAVIADGAKATAATSNNPLAPIGVSMGGLGGKVPTGPSLGVKVPKRQG